MLRITLEAARVNAGMLQTSVAEKLGVSRNTLSRWERGLTYPRADQLHTLCDLYGVGTDDIFLPAESTKSEP